MENETAKALNSLLDRLPIIDNLREHQMIEAAKLWEVTPQFQKDQLIGDKFIMVNHTMLLGKTTPYVTTEGKAFLKDGGYKRAAKVKSTQRFKDENPKLRIIIIYILIPIIVCVLSAILIKYL